MKVFSALLTGSEVPPFKAMLQGTSILSKFAILAFQATLFDLPHSGLGVVFDLLKSVLKFSFPSFRFRPDDFVHTSGLINIRLRLTCPSCAFEAPTPLELVAEVIQSHPGHNISDPTRGCAEESIQE